MLAFLCLAIVLGVGAVLALPTSSFALDSDEPSVLADNANPQFTVQYYGRLDMLATSKDGFLQILDTSGGKLPTNGGDLPTTGLYVEDDGSLRSEVRLEKLYADNEYSYFSAPGLPYVNVFRSNGNYQADEVWVLNEGCDPTSTDRSDWTIYENITSATDLNLTNNPSKVDDKTILITDGTVIRLVADQTTGAYDNSVTFYDYDITDDGKVTWDRENGTHGINSLANYSNTGAKLAFGNANTGTSLQTERWGVNWLNQYNREDPSNSSSPELGFKGCTFGLVTGLDSNGHIQYAQDVDAPNLFDEGDATGKTTYADKYTLNFKRSGDTYTLSSVSNADGTVSSASNLDLFNNPVCGGTTYTHIWTNNFWPMDGENNVDPHTGNYMDRGEYTGYDGTKLYPPSDDGLSHNNMFGMQYSVTFTLSEDYVGPLEYYFFGDDDMWVFLDGQLICDIGGVHSSVGEYVNLWDYLEKGSANSAGEHTLKFYYTERGLSGSTCYMQFTLPEVSQAEPTYQNSPLTIEKQVVGLGADQEFAFDIELTDASGAALASNYNMERYDASGALVETTLLEEGKGSFTLKGGEKLVINFLQHGTKYTITEKNTGEYVVSNVVDGGAATHSVTATGQVQTGAEGSTVVFTNAGTPTVDKQVQEDSTGAWGGENTAEIGDTVNFRTTVHAMPGAASYVLHDEMGEGLTLDPESVRVTGLTEGTDYTVSTAGLADGCDFEITFSEDYLSRISQPTDIEVTYTAVLNESAQIFSDSNANATWLDYHNGVDVVSTPHSDTETYTFKVDVVKTDEGNKVLDGAQFRLYDAKTDGTEVALVKVSDGVYRLAKDGERGVDHLVTVNGQLTVAGLDADTTYWLEETAAPDGYVKLTDRVEIAVKDANLEATVANGAWQSGGVHVVNELPETLPKSGDVAQPPVLPLIAAGGVLCAAAGAIRFLKRGASAKG
ncbi:fibro-slime domain-containing protein [Thermophilibacter sp.]|uniref:DUF7601 domain-containing protein n=1 Tax=Thermophilibacter sp. TaxID=2847309 RepID=UPI003A91325C